MIHEINLAQQGSLPRTLWHLTLHKNWNLNEQIIDSQFIYKELETCTVRFILTVLPLLYIETSIILLIPTKT